MIQKLRAKAGSKRGFTLAELLIVVAIIGVLVAIAIPTFSGALDKANKAVDEANVRAAYAEWTIDKMTDDSYTEGDVKATAKEATDYFITNYTGFKHSGYKSVAVDAKGVWSPSTTAAPTT